MKVRTHTFNKKKYTVYLGPLKGATDVSKNGSLEMLIRTSKMSDYDILDTIVHESLHACNWDASEMRVHKTARDISRFLWRLGYRRGRSR